MNILYLGNWSVQDGLSHSTIRPHLRILANLDQISTLLYVSIERKKNNLDCNWNIDKLSFKPYYSSKLGSFADLLVLPFFLNRLIKQHNIDLLISRSSPAGNYAFLTYKLTGVPFVVESFEPHAHYMLDNRVWSKYSAKYLLQRFLENKQLIHARKLITVSDNYFEALQINNSAKSKLLCAPCAVNVDEYRFNSKDRDLIRAKYSIRKDALVGIYVGKFGDIYFGPKVISMFALLKTLINNFYLILLTDDKNRQITRALKEAGLFDNDYSVLYVSPDKVHEYLSAADFAISLVRSTNSSKYCSPIKHGEYWANGLPMLLDYSIGDDSELTLKNRAGIVVNMSNGINQDDWNQLKLIIEETKNNRASNRMVSLAMKYRNFDNVRKAYVQVLSAVLNEG